MEENQILHKKIKLLTIDVHISNIQIRLLIVHEKERNKKISEPEMVNEKLKTLASLVAKYFQCLFIKQRKNH